MKTKWFSKVMSSLFAFTLIFGSVSMANAKGPESGKSQEKPAKDHEEGKSTCTEDKSTCEDDNSTGKEQKSNGKEQKNNNGAKKKVVIKSNIGKSLEKRINASESNINSITKSINTYFNVNADGTTDKEFSKKTVSSKYNSYKGKLNAEINKLRALDKQLAAYKKKYKSNSTELDALALMSKELQKLAANEITRVKTLANEASSPKTTDEETQPTDPTQPTDQTTQPTDQTTQPTDQTTQPTDPVTQPTT